MPKSWNTMTLTERIKLVLTALLSACILLFILQNTETVQVSFLWLTFGLARWVMLPLFFILGGATGYLFARRNRKMR